MQLKARIRHDRHVQITKLEEKMAKLKNSS